MSFIKFNAFIGNLFNIFNRSISSLIPFFVDAHESCRKNCSTLYKHLHLHMVEINSDFWKRHLFFMEYLRKNPETSAEYQKLKETLAKQFQNDVFNYCAAKSDFIQKVLAKNSSNENIVA